LQIGDIGGEGKNDKNAYDSKQSNKISALMKADFHCVYFNIQR